ncbi:aldehyde dehydrogenase [Paraoerskovia sediminicola]|uniref:Aldehyde dehydrogenase n=1 Tax=Paraoerskovia sediminicola TaxID=1138587 RepID=A0ABM8G1N3_9CELL|nr:aldehyde dehydrogenase family protein [Paraoerskovia sediminicola]BDZ41955.1 aldehyde dehydrogenase [Paraoerskovia sediminicola]
MTDTALFTDEGLLGPVPAALVAGVREDDPSHGTLPVVNPATGAHVADVPLAPAETVDRAVRAAAQAQKAWGARTPLERAAVLEEISRLFAVHAEELARIVTTEQGKPYDNAVGEAHGARTFFDFAISQKYRPVGEKLVSDPGRSLETVEVPIGVVAAVLPWNFPVAIFARKVAPALMAGNAVVVKPSEFTPLSALALARLCQLAGLPDGVLSVVCGDGRVTGAALVSHPAVGMVTMTGSTRGGREILASTAQSIIPVSLELGGKAPFIIFEDADIDRAIEDAADARLWNSGQVCTCNEVTYVHASIHDEFVRRVSERYAAITPSAPDAPGSTFGPLVAERERARVQAMVDAAVEAGATVEVGGGRPAGDEFAEGAWFAPTLLSGVTSDMAIARTEVFGPVLPVIPFETEAEVVAAANSTAFGLSAYVYTRDLSRSMRMIADLEFGEVYVNQAGPESVRGYHSGWKDSGLGGDDGAHGYEKYLRRKTAYVTYER